MANFFEMTAQHDSRVGHYAARLHRIEIHIKRQERRAARAQIDGMFYELERLIRDLELPAEFIIAGANLGFLSGRGNLLRGRMVATVLGAGVGWLFGQAAVQDLRRDVHDLMHWTLRLEEALRILEREV